ncbi:hypothetical protein [Streptomyces sp. NPDC015242]
MVSFSLFTIGLALASGAAVRSGHEATRAPTNPEPRRRAHAS